MDGNLQSLLEELKQLREENARLQTRLTEVLKQNADLQKQNADLAAEVAKLKAALEESRRGGKRQAAPFRKPGGPVAEPKKPGRKSGDEHGQHRHRAVPAKIDETYEVPLPDACPHCGERHIQGVGVESQFQTEVPRQPIHREFKIHIGVCGDCGERVQGRHELQTSDALGAAASQLGPDAHATLALMNKELGLSHGKCATFFGQVFGINISRATSARSILRTADRCEAAYESIKTNIRGSPVLSVDETGWRVGGVGWWLHAVVGAQATYYEVAPHRGREVLADLIGLDWSGILVHDGWSPYNLFKNARHQQCLAHILRRIHELLETASGGAVVFPRAVRDLLKEGLAVRDRHTLGEISDHGKLVRAGQLEGTLARLIAPVKTNPDNERLASFLEKHHESLFTFLKAEGVEATNWPGEQAMRPAVVNRKVWGGNRTEDGAHAQSVLTSVVVTCKKLIIDPLQFLASSLCSKLPVPLFK